MSRAVWSWQAAPWQHSTTGACRGSHHCWPLVPLQRRRRLSTRTTYRHWPLVWMAPSGNDGGSDNQKLNGVLEDTPTSSSSTSVVELPNIRRIFCLSLVLPLTPSSPLRLRSEEGAEVICQIRHRGACILASGCSHPHTAEALMMTSEGGPTSKMRMVGVSMLGSMTNCFATARNLARRA